MGKNIKYGEFTFNKPNPRPTVKGYSFGGAAESAAEPMAAKQPMGMSPPLNPTKKPVVTPPPAPLTPAMQRQKENQAIINKANARDGGNRLIDPAAMKAALDRNLAIRQATDARHKAEAIANRVPSRSPYRHDQMQQAKAEKARLLTSPPKTTPMKKGGEVKGYAMGGEYQVDDAPIQRRNAKLKSMKLKMAEDAKRDAAQARSRYEAEQEMSQSKANLLPSPVRMKKGGEVQGYAFGGITEFISKAKQQGLLDSKNSQPAPTQNMGFIRKALQSVPQNFSQSSGLIGRALESNPQQAPTQNMGFIRKALQGIPTSFSQNSGLIGRALESNPQPAPTQNMGFIRKALQRVPQNFSQNSGLIGRVLASNTGFKEGGSVSKANPKVSKNAKSMESSSKDKAQDKAMIKKAMKQHDQQEHKGGKGTVLKLKQGGKPPVKGVKLVGMKREPQAVIKKEISLLKKAGAPAKMIKHEEIEAASPMVSMGGMRKGGSAMKKGVPTFNRTPKC